MGTKKPIADPKRRAGRWIENGGGGVVRTLRPPEHTLDVLLDLRDAILAEIWSAERQVGAWEDDGGRPEPDGISRCMGLVIGYGLPGRVVAGD